MRRILVLAPHFPPADTVDMHRVRMTIGFYRDNGWNPTVLCVRAEDTGRLIDPALVHTVPADIPVEAVSVPKKPLQEAFGVRALGLRASGALYRRGAALMEKDHFDLVFISTTAFPLMNLGARWKSRLGTPFVLDFQDPWATYPASGQAFFRKGARHALMRALHRRLEARTVPKAAGLMAVSQTYLDLLSAAYPAVAARPALVSPFGYAERDFEAARRHGRALPQIAAARAQGRTVCLFAGRVAPTMERTLARLFALVAEGRAAGLAAFERLTFLFAGTGYGGGQEERIASRLAAAAGIADLVVEDPGRIPLLDAWRSTLEADLLLVMGSDDEGYTPSKLNALLSLEKPLICAAPQASPAIRATAGMDTVAQVTIEGAEGAAGLAATLERLVAGQGDYAARMRQAKAFEAAACARRDCGLFDRAVS